MDLCGYFCEWANEIKAQKFVPQLLSNSVNSLFGYWENVGNKGNCNMGCQVFSFCDLSKKILESTFNSWMVKLNPPKDETVNKKIACSLQLGRQTFSKWSFSL